MRDHLNVKKRSRSFKPGHFVRRSRARNYLRFPPFRPCVSTVRHPLQVEAKRDLRLNRELRRLDRIEYLILDDIGYVQHHRSDMEVLFALLAARYERRSVAITSNLVFSKWDQIFQDPMTTAAAIDRVVHHSVILELNVKSYRAESAQGRARPGRRKQEQGPDA